VLVVGMAPSRNGADLSDARAAHPAGKTLDRLAKYAGVAPEDLLDKVDFVNLLPDWPGEASEASAKWDDSVSKQTWDPVGQRSALLAADLAERPRKLVVGLGGWVRDALSWWWTLLDAGWLEPQSHAGAGLVWSPHPAGTSMWWNDPANLEKGEAFWAAALLVANTGPLAPRKVPAALRSKWLLDLVARFRVGGWPEEACVDWPFMDPPGRPSAYHRGNAMPAAHVVLELTQCRRKDRFQQALHSCDRGEDCVNSAHLRWGTELENRLDQSARARGDIGRVGLETARSVRKDLEQISKAYGVPMDAIRRIAGGKTWAETSWTEETT
jgi:hypothetical protein